MIWPESWLAGYQPGHLHVSLTLLGFIPLMVRPSDCVQTALRSPHSVSLWDELWDGAFCPFLLVLGRTHSRLGQVPHTVVPGMQRPTKLAGDESWGFLLGMYAFKHICFHLGCYHLSSLYQQGKVQP